MHWGHLISSDLVNWTEQKIALAPGIGFDNYGVWSGCSIKDSMGNPTLFYTGVNGIQAGIGKANSNDSALQYWENYEYNPLIASPPSGYETMDFRDPTIWKSDSIYYMIVGSGLQNNGGGILFMYSSRNLTNWTAMNPLFQSSDVSESGYFWEMPFFFSLPHNLYILGTTPIPTETTAAATIYWIGKWENNSFTPLHNFPSNLELINGKLLSPSLNYDTAGRLTYIGIIPEDRDVSDQINAGWRNTFSLPRVIRLLNDTQIGQIPHPNLCRLHQNEVSISNRTILPGQNNNLPEVSGNQSELQFKVKADSASRFTIQVFKSPDSAEYTSIIFDLAENTIMLSRSHSSLNTGANLDIRSASYVFDFHDTIRVDVFLDHSVIEVFVDQLTVFSARVYPTLLQSQQVDFIVNKGSADIIELDSWTMASMNMLTSSEICEPENLPSSFRKNNIETGINTIHQTPCNIQVYPNPANSFLNIEWKSSLENPVNIDVYDMTGFKRISKNVTLINFPINYITLDVSMLSNGIYILHIADDREENTQKFIVSK